MKVHLLHWFFDLLFPPACFGCAMEGVWLCERCTHALHREPPRCFFCGLWTLSTQRRSAGRTCDSCRVKTLVSVYCSPFSYRDPLARALITQLKYHRMRPVAGLLGDHIAAYMHEFSIIIPPDAVLVPIPLVRSRQRVRGFNQAELIAASVSDHLRVPMRSALLRRIKRGPPQVTLSGSARRERMKNAFVAVGLPDVMPRTVILVDDVRTTGATIEDAARALREAGVRSVWAVTAAH